MNVELDFEYMNSRITYYMMIIAGAIVFISSTSNAYAHTPSDAICMDDVCNVDILGLQDPAYDPPVITVKSGATIVFENHAPEIHTATSTDFTEDERNPIANDIFDTGLLRQGEQAKVVINDAGEYNYFCAVHPNDMRGVVKVLGTNVPESKDSSNDNVTVEYKGNKFDIDATLTNGDISDIKVDEDFTSIVLTVDTNTEDGELTITLPRELIDSKFDNADDDFIVLVNGDDLGYDEINTDERARTLTIPVPHGTEEIEIIGTQVVPEFGIITALTLTTAIAGIVLVSRKYVIKP